MLGWMKSEEGPWADSLLPFLTLATWGEAQAVWQPRGKMMEGREEVPAMK